MKFFCVFFVFQLFFIHFVAGEVSILQGKQFISVGQERFLTCELEDIDEDAVDKVVWKKDGKEIADNGRLKYEDLELLISSIETSDAGSYTCEVVVEGKAQVSAPVSLTLYEKIKFRNCETSVLFQKGAAEGKLTCDATSVPVARFSWSFGDAPINKKMDKYKVEKKQLTVRDVELSDAGVYHFIAKQSRMGIRERHAINVTVHEPLALLTKGLTVDVVEGEDAQIHCKASGFPAPVYTFLNGSDETLSVDKAEGFTVEVKESATLFIKAAKPEYPDKIICSVNNQYTEAREIYRLNVLTAPKIVGFTNVTGKASQKLEVTCRVQANPKVIIEIGRVSADKSQKGDLKQRSSEATESFTYVQEEASLENEGEYYCLAIHNEVTRFPDAQSTAHVEILYKPMIEDDKNTKVVKTWLENAVELVCVVKSKPAPSILWLTEDDDGNEVHKSFDGVTEPPSGEVDSFAGYTSEHPDNYYHSHIWIRPHKLDKIVRLLKCQASNDLGSSTNTFEVQEAFPPGPPKLSNIVDLTATSFKVVVEDVDDGGTPVFAFKAVYYVEGNRSATEQVKKFLVKKNHAVLKLQGLKQKTSYVVEVSAENGVGPSDAGRINATTKDREIPTKVHISMNPEACHSLSNTVVNWEEPYSSGLPITLYRIWYKKLEKKMASGFHNVPTDDLSTWSNVQGTERSIKLKGLEEMSQYVVFVEAQNDVGWSKDKELHAFHVCKEEPEIVAYVGPARFLPSSKKGAGTSMRGQPAFILTLASFAAFLLFFV